MIGLPGHLFLPSVASSLPSSSHPQELGWRFLRSTTSLLGIIIIALSTVLILINVSANCSWYGTGQGNLTWIVDGEEVSEDADEVKDDGD